MKQLIFAAVNKPELIDVPVREPRDNEVLVKTAFSTISCGTERANLTGSTNVGPGGGMPVYPVALGYSTSGIVEKIGKDVTSVEPGDRVAMYWTVHAEYNTPIEERVVKITDERVSLRSAALMHIGCFPLAALRKTRLEIGESMLAMGLGILGQFAVTLAHAAGAVPVIAADPNPVRREEALAGGADYAFDPTEPGFAEKVKVLTGGGVNTCIEVTGVGAGLNEALDCMAPFGRVALLGCTRNPNFTVDYYQKVHKPGITLIGAHTMARPEKESRPGWFTVRDDIKSLMKLVAEGRIDLESKICETHSPLDGVAVYNRLIEDKNFPTVVQFDWSQL